MSTYSMVPRRIDVSGRGAAPQTDRRASQLGRSWGRAVAGRTRLGAGAAPTDAGLVPAEVGGRSEDHALERAVRHRHGETGRVREPLSKARKQRSSPGDEEAASVKLRGEVGWAAVEHVADGREYLGQRLV